MKLLIITRSCNPNGDGFSLRVHNLVQMASRVANVSVLSTYDSADPNIAGVKFYHQLFPEGLTSKLKRMANYYRTTFEKIRIDDPPDIVQIEHPDLFGLARQFTGTPIILDEHNVWWRLEESNMQQGPTIRRLPCKKPLMKWLLYCAKKYESKALTDSSHVIVCSNADRKEFLKELPCLTNKISYIPNCLDVDRYKVETSDRGIVLFMGSLAYFPNMDAVRLICEEIAPRVDAEFHILGAGLSDIKPPSNVRFLGRVEDVRPCIRNAMVCIAPLMYGSGSRLKILEYMAMGKATIATAKGAEGLEITPGKDIVIENDMAAFANRINTLLKDNTLRKGIGTRARHTIENKYDYRLYSNSLKAIYSCLKT